MKFCLISSSTVLRCYYCLWLIPSWGTRFKLYFQEGARCCVVLLVLKAFIWSELCCWCVHQVPQQTNLCDCGLFLLHYVEVFLRASQVYQPQRQGIPDFVSWSLPAYSFSGVEIRFWPCFNWHLTIGHGNNRSTSISWRSFCNLLK
jgi:hypothetical protein